MDSRLCPGARETVAVLSGKRRQEATDTSVGPARDSGAQAGECAR